MKTRLRSAWQLPAVCLIAATLLSLSALATHTLFWRTASYSDFERGTATGVALWSDGMLEPAAKFATFADPNVAYLWSLRVDSQGRLYASGGSSARVFRFDSAGHATTVFQSSDLTAQAIALDSHDDLFVATSPDGKVYKVTPAGQSSVFFDPKTKYIWSLAVDPEGNLYVGTGDTGEVFAVTPAGKSRLFFKSDERHIRALALDGKGNLLVGTDPNGLVIRVAIRRGAPGEPPAAGSAFVLYETAGQEITALTLGAGGNIYAAAIGFKREAETPAVAVRGETFVFSSETPAAVAQAQAQGRPGPQQAAPPGAAPQPAPLNPFAAAPQGGSHVYRIAPDGSPTLLWESPADLVYALGFSPSGKLLLGTGNSGAVIELEGDELFSKAAETTSAQVTGFASGPGGRVYLCTANPGKIFALGPGTTTEATFTSAPFDAKIFSHWGRLNWWGQGATGGQVSFYVRSGNTSNPDENWSQWYGPYDAPQSQPAGCPPSRFVQWKAVFHRAAGVTPTLSWVSLAYLPKTVAPEIDDIVMEDPGVSVRSVLVPQGTESMLPVQLRMPQTNPSGIERSVAPESAPAQTATFQPPPQGFREKGWESVLWSAHDANGDQLEYSIYYRGEGENTWKLLKDHLRETFYSWDTTAMPDGAYYLKIVASNAPSNPPADALTTERIGPRFVVDNTPPDISGLRAQTVGEDATIQFAAKDPSTPLVSADYSVDAGPWTVVEPVGRLSDAPSETYQIVLKPLSAGEHTISVRVFDLYDNSAIAKITFTVNQAKSAGH